MKNYIDSQEHWEDYVNDKYDRIQEEQKEMERQINKQIESEMFQYKIYNCKVCKFKKDCYFSPNNVACDEFETES